MDANPAQPPSSAALIHPSCFATVTAVELEVLRRKARALSEIERLIENLVAHLPDIQTKPIGSISNSLQSIHWVIEDAKA